MLKSKSRSGTQPSDPSALPEVASASSTSEMKSPSKEHAERRAQREEEMAAKITDHVTKALLARFALREETHVSPSTPNEKKRPHSAIAQYDAMDLDASTLSKRGKLAEEATPSAGQSATLNSPTRADASPPEASISSGGGTSSSGPFAPPPSSFDFDMSYKYQLDHWKDVGKVEAFNEDNVRAIMVLLKVRDRARQYRVPPNILTRILTDVVTESTLNWHLQSGTHGYEILEKVGNYILKKSHLVIMVDTQYPLFHQPSHMKIMEYFNIIFKFMTIEQAQAGPARQHFFLRLTAGISSESAEVKELLLEKIEELAKETKYADMIPSEHFNIIWRRVSKEKSTTTGHSNSASHTSSLPHHNSKFKRGDHPRHNNFNNNINTTTNNTAAFSASSQASTADMPQSSQDKRPPKLPKYPCRRCESAGISHQMHWQSDCPLKSGGYQRSSEHAQLPSPPPPPPPQGLPASYNGPQHNKRSQGN